MHPGCGGWTHPWTSPPREPKRPPRPRPRFWGKPTGHGQRPVTLEPNVGPPGTKNLEGMEPDQSEDSFSSLGQMLAQMEEMRRAQVEENRQFCGQLPFPVTRRRRGPPFPRTRRNCRPPGNRGRRQRGRRQRGRRQRSWLINQLEQLVDHQSASGRGSQICWLIANHPGAEAI
ncbi:hypothetical protein EYF80_053002 [Liparis tanakae]|uniref:Uncharacterized protein n=1 Tax=Liparis tanakae TaxID=230148 RepID=A0A4Z2F6E7_9TELE|nr:hypothetical protein EYF80_053002 [Liparis tanakae]